MKGKGIFLVGALALLAACGGGGGGGGGNEYSGTSSPGDVWRWTIFPTTFAAENITLNNVYGGAKTDLASGFLRLLVTASTDPDDVGNVPYVAYGIEFPETLLIAQRATDAAASVLAGVGPCPTVSADFNWVTVPEDMWDAATDSAYGTAATTITGSDFDFVIDKYLLDGTPNPPQETVDDFTCVDGELTHQTLPTTATITPSGVYVVDNGPNAGGAVGVAAATSNLDISDIVSREYRGVLIKRAPHPFLLPPAMVDETEAIGARNNPASPTDSLIGFGYTDIDNNIEKPASVTVTLTGQATPGIITGTLTDSNGTRPITFVVNMVNGRWMLFGISTDLSALEPYNIFLIEKV